MEKRIVLKKLLHCFQQFSHNFHTKNPKIIQVSQVLNIAATSDQVYQLLAHGRWFSPGTPASSTTKTGRHDIAEILLKEVLSTIYPL
jgi:hypothetical protein